MTNRRRFIMMVPLAGAALAAACSKGTPEAVPAPAPAAAPEPAPAPVAAAAPEPTAAAAPAPASPSGAGPMVEESDATAVALGYVSDAARVDKAKHTNFVEGSACSKCALYQGTAGSEAGPCPLYAGKQVSAKGWCSSFAKKAA